MRDLHELPKFRDGLSYLYLEHARIEQDAAAIALFDKRGKIPVPCANLSVLLLGPGTSITHAAIKTLADTGCFVIWCGEEGIRFYAQGQGETRSAKNVIQQAKLVSDALAHLQVVQKMYAIRFREPIDPTWSIQQLRGREGQRVKQAYKEIGEKLGISWTGRKYSPLEWDAADPINQALSVANTCLYGLCHAAIVTIGLSPALGFIHTGHQRSFVFDLADLYKIELTIPLALYIVSKGTHEIERRTRYACRAFFHANRLLPLIIRDLEFLLDENATQIPSDRNSFDFVLKLKELAETTDKLEVSTITPLPTDTPISPENNDNPTENADIDDISNDPGYMEQVAATTCKNPTQNSNPSAPFFSPIPNPSPSPYPNLPFSPPPQNVQMGLNPPSPYPMDIPSRYPPFYSYPPSPPYMHGISPNYRPTPVSGSPSNQISSLPINLPNMNPHSSAPMAPISYSYPFYPYPTYPSPPNFWDQSTPSSYAPPSMGVPSSSSSSTASPLSSSLSTPPQSTSPVSNSHPSHPPPCVSHPEAPLDPDDDCMTPANLWDPHQGEIPGGRNHAHSIPPLPPPASLPNKSSPPQVLQKIISPSVSTPPPNPTPILPPPDQSPRAQNRNKKKSNR